MKFITQVPELSKLRMLIKGFFNIFKIREVAPLAQRRALV